MTTYILVITMPTTICQTEFNKELIKCNSYDINNYLTVRLYSVTVRGNKYIFHIITFQSYSYNAAAS